MRHQHPSAAISLATELIHRVTFPAGEGVGHQFSGLFPNPGTQDSAVLCLPIRNTGIQEHHIPFPEVGDDLQ